MRRNLLAGAGAAAAPLAFQEQAVRQSDFFLLEDVCVQRLPPLLFGEFLRILRGESSGVAGAIKMLGMSLQHLYQRARAQGNL